MITLVAAEFAFHLAEHHMLQSIVEYGTIHARMPIYRFYILFKHLLFNQYIYIYIYIYIFAFSMIFVFPPTQLPMVATLFHQHTSSFTAVVG
jgi:hypothetical protein